MQMTTTLQKQVLEAVQVSMRIEGYQPTRSSGVQSQAKALMEQQRVQVSVPRK